MTFAISNAPRVITVFAVALWAIGPLGCSGPDVAATDHRKVDTSVKQPVEKTPARNDENNTTTIREPTVGMLSDQRVGVYNIWERDYTDHAGESKRAMTASVSLVDREDDPVHVVGVGSRITIGSDTYEVIAVERRRDDDNPGYVTFRPVP